VACTLAQFFTRDYIVLWVLLLAVLLYFPVRQLIAVLYIRRAQKKIGEVDEAEQLRLKKRAGMTAGLLSLMFSYFYVAHLFSS
jgi:hypothetical protein